MGNHYSYQSYNFLDATAETNYTEILRQHYYKHVESEAEAFYEIKEMVDESEEIQKFFFEHKLKFPNSQDEMNTFIESLTQE